MSENTAPRTRRRGADLEGPIFDAVWDELTEAGWRDFQVNRVALRAGASKASIYRRWPDREALVLAALLHKTSHTPAPTPITGDARRDLLTFLEFHCADLERGLGEAIRGVLAGLTNTAGLPDSDRRPTAGIALVIEILEASPEFDDPSSLPARVINLGPGVAAQHYLGTGAAPRGEDLAEIVDLIWLPSLRAARDH